MQVKQALEQRFPGIEVQGGAYPVAPIKVHSKGVRDTKASVHRSPVAKPSLPYRQRWGRQ